MPAYLGGSTVKRLRYTPTYNGPAPLGAVVIPIFNILRERKNHDRPENTL